MDIKYDNENKMLIIKLLEEIDHHSCECIRRRSDFEISKYKPKRVIMDLKSVSFMDSSGIGMILGRYKQVIRNNGQMSVINVCPNVKRIFEMSGIFKIISLYENMDDVLKTV